MESTTKNSSLILKLQNELNQSSWRQLANYLKFDGSQIVRNGEGNLKQTKLEQIRNYIDNCINSSKERGRMHGSIPQIESQWWVLDQIYCLLEGIPTMNFWGTFLGSKGFGAKSASHAIKEMNAENPYLELMKLRNEFESWRNKEIRKMKKAGEFKKPVYIGKYKKMNNPKTRSALLLGQKYAWSMEYPDL